MDDSRKNIENSEEEIDLLDYLNVIIKRRRMIVRNAFVAAILMALISLVLPKTYTATTTLLPPDEGEQSALRSLLSNPPASFLSLPGVPASSSDIFVEILKSRSVAKQVLNRKYEYDGNEAKLIEIWDIDKQGEAIEELHSKSRIYANEQGIVEISVELSEPKLAAQVANAFAEELDRVNKEKSISKAKNSRIYIEEQLRKTERHLKEASAKLAKFQSKYKAVDLEEQTKVTIEKAGEIKGTILAKEVELEVMLQTMKPDNPVVVRRQKELEELKEQFEHLQFGNAVPFEEQKDYFIPFADVPEVGQKLAELIRDVKVQETVWELLNQQYYSAKIQEARDTPTVQVLDEAVPPEKRTKPKRRLLVLVATALAFMSSVFWAFVLEYTENIRSRENEFEKVNNIITEVKSDYLEFKEWLNNALNRIKKR
ncbi:hypothetical protein GWO43_11010 [candidate division KSB1 bacterium]|nr:hypothetical protein [candidate division KSB1 bacterium]NIR70301.1 hypothetical protein [candidate division KSB1 bacterium]NIS24462.1 hypothetical protein [candidate division KSB1 bacterium]NIT71398.1 hypothetical protein [candidate division KSB1 bacterium]NIU25082.1 hypothetical protein [candidate division KSB1 bacterium]